MRRSPALASLSRDHHVALEVALRLRRATAESVEAAVERWETYWDEHGARHFEIEERLILGALPSDDGEWHAAADRVRDEHAAVRAAVPGLRAGSAEDRGAAARALGQLLHDHVRFEERHLFALLEERLPEEELAVPGRALDAAG